MGWAMMKFHITYPGGRQFTVTGDLTFEGHQRLPFIVVMHGDVPTSVGIDYRAVIKAENGDVVYDGSDRTEAIFEAFGS